jgi:hypothetical protein
VVRATPLDRTDGDSINLSRLRESETTEIFCCGCRCETIELPATSACRPRGGYTVEKRKTGTAFLLLVLLSLSLQRTLDGHGIILQYMLYLTGSTRCFFLHCCPTQMKFDIMPILDRRRAVSWKAGDHSRRWDWHSVNEDWPTVFPVKSFPRRVSCLVQTH